MADVSLTFWKPDGTVVYVNPTTSMIVEEFSANTFSGSHTVTQLPGREYFLVTRARGQRNGQGNPMAYGALSGEAKVVKIQGNVITWNIPNEYQQKIGGFFGPWNFIELFFTVVAR